jgi:putative hemolysin
MSAIVSNLSGDTAAWSLRSGFRYTTGHCPRDVARPVIGRHAWATTSRMPPVGAAGVDAMTTSWAEQPARIDTTRAGAGPAPATAAPNPPNPPYRVGLADAPDVLHAAQRLRFEVFNLELGEGLVRSYASGRDADEFDAACDHLVVHETTSGRVVGTYRLQTGVMAAAALGYYGEREFDFAPFEPHRPRMVELGRACIAAEHRTFAVLNLLWRGIAHYALARGARYLVGCSSITSQDQGVGAAAWQRLQPHAVAATLATVPRAEFACALEHPGPPPKIPRLMTAYLALGAKVCGPPAIDREFGTIDFLTWLDLEDAGLAGARRRGRYLASTGTA